MKLRSKLASSVAALALTAGPALAQQSPITTYVAQGSQFLASVLINSGALSGVTNSPKGTYSGWVRGSLSNDARGVHPQMLNANIATTWDYTAANSEVSAGFNLALDNASGHNGSLRINIGNINGTVNSNGGAGYVSPVWPLLNTAWQHILVSWDNSGSTSYVAAYVNGVQVAAGGAQHGAFNVGYAYASGITLGCAVSCGFGFGGFPAGSSNLFADMADVWIDFSHSILKAGTNTIAPGDIGKFYNMATGKPVRINNSGHCTDPEGYQPTMCFTNDNSTFTTNAGSGGPFAVSVAPANASGSLTLATSDVAVVAANYPTPRAAHTVAQNWENGGQGGTPPTTTADSNQIAVGDLLVAVIQISSNSSTDPGAITLINGQTIAWAGWTQLSQNFCASCSWDQEYQRVGVFYKIATSADATPYNGVTATGATGTGTYAFSGPSGQRASSWRLIDYVGVNQTTPIDAAAGRVNTTGSTNIALPTITTIYANELVVGVALDWGTNEGSYTVAGASPRGSDQIFATSSWRPEILHFDKQFPTAGSTAGFATVTRSAAHLGQTVVFGIVPQ